jgi:hypothetical protein
VHYALETTGFFGGVRVHRTPVSMRATERLTAWGRTSPFRGEAGKVRNSTTFNQPTELASDVGSVRAAVPGTLNPCAADEFMPNTTGDIIRLTAGSQLHAA